MEVRFLQPWRRHKAGHIPGRRVTKDFIPEALERHAPGPIFEHRFSLFGSGACRARWGWRVVVKRLESDGVCRGSSLRRLPGVACEAWADRHVHSRSLHSETERAIFELGTREWPMLATTAGHIVVDDHRRPDGPFLPNGIFRAIRLVAKRNPSRQIRDA